MLQRLGLGKKGLSGDDDMVPNVVKPNPQGEEEKEKEDDADDDEEEKEDDADADDDEEEKEDDADADDDEEDDDEDDEDDEENEVEPAAGAATESAMCTKNPNVKYDLDDSKEIVSISFHLSKKYGFQVNKDVRGTKFDTPVYPVLYKIEGHSGQPPKIGILKNKACIEKNLPADLSNYLTILNTVLLNEYTRYYDAGKFGELVEAQQSFLEGQVQGQEGQGQVQGQEVQGQEGQGGQVAEDEEEDEDEEEGEEEAEEEEGEEE
jgi:hypothetical protein